MTAYEVLEPSQFRYPELHDSLYPTQLPEPTAPPLLSLEHAWTTPQTATLTVRTSSQGRPSTSSSQETDRMRSLIELFMACLSKVRKEVVKWAIGSTEPRLAKAYRKIESLEAEKQTTLVQRDVALQQASALQAQALRVSAATTVQAEHQKAVSLHLQQDLNRVLGQNFFELHVRSSVDRKYIESLERRNQELLEIVQGLQKENAELRSGASVQRELCIQKEATLTTFREVLVRPNQTACVEPLGRTMMHGLES